MFKRHLFSNVQAVKYENTGFELKFLLQLPWLHISHHEVSLQDLLQRPTEKSGIGDSWSQGKGNVGDGTAAHTVAKRVMPCFGKASILQRADYCSDEGFTSPQIHPGI